MKNYLIIDKTELEERIKELREVNSPAVNHICSIVANELVDILSSGKDLQPVLENTFKEGYVCDGLEEGTLEETRQEYINNFKL